MKSIKNRVNSEQISTSKTFKKVIKTCEKRGALKTNTLEKEYLVPLKTLRMAFQSSQGRPQSAQRCPRSVHGGVILHVFYKVFRKVLKIHQKTKENDN